MSVSAGKNVEYDNVVYYIQLGLMYLNSVLKGV